MTKITVVIATHNSELWITEALESVRAQTYPRDRIETIVVDDGSSDASASLARWFLERHGMEGSVLATDQPKGIGAAMNLGWRAAAGDWIQCVKGQDLLAPNKIEIQANLIPQLPEDTRVICSSWQRMRLRENQWQVAGPVNPPNLGGPVVLELVTPRAGRLGASLFRRKAIQTVAGFSEDATFTVEEHFMLKMAGSGEGARLSGRGSGPFVEAPSLSPLFSEREGTAADSRHWKVSFARQHIENILVARAMLREHQRGLLTPENIREIAIFCGESLRDLREHDRAAFKQCSQWLREIDPSLLLTQTDGSRSKIQVAAHLIAPMRHRITSGSTALVSTMYQGERSLRNRFDRGWRKPSGRLRAGRRQTAALGLTGRGESVLTTGALIVVATIALLGTADLFGTHGSPFSPVAHPQPVQKLSGGTPIINVASTIYAEPLSPWPMPVEIGPSQQVSPDSILHVRGLPSAVTLSEGRRVSADVWAVPLVGLSNLELLVAKGASGRSHLTLALVGVDGNTLAEARTAISINEPSGMKTRVAATANLSPGNPVQTTKEAGPGLAMTGTLPEPIAPTIKPEPPHARAVPTAAELVTPLPMTNPSHEKAAPQPVPERETAPSPSPKPPIAVAPAELNAPPNLTASAIAPSRSLATVRPNDDHEAASQALAERAQREVKTAPTATPGPSHPTASPLPAVPSVAAAKPDRAPESKASALVQEDRQRVEKMIARGERELADGNVSVARQFFLRAAEAGIARGALLLASTYDAHEYVRLRIQGVQPNPGEARKWYKRAHELDATLADEQLLRLGAAE
jgi:glycosyl transferase family 2